MSETSPASPYLTTREVADLIRSTVPAVRQMRHRGTGPQGTRVGRGVLYDAADVRAWLKAKADADRVRQRAASA